MNTQREAEYERGGINPRVVFSYRRTGISSGLNDPPPPTNDQKENNNNQ
jgi:hypothetical protein